jgi:hypothetical protein
MRAFVAVEAVHAMPQQGTASMFSFGEAFGAVRMFAEMLGCEKPVYYAPPGSWKKSFGITMPLTPENEALSRGQRNYKLKKLAVAKARDLFPAARRQYLAAESSSGRAEALLLAHWLHAVLTNPQKAKRRK